VSYNLELTEAQIRSEMGRPREALNIVERLLEKDQTGPVWYRCGLLNYELGDFDRAIEAFEKAIEKESQIPVYHGAMAEVLLQMDEYEEAAEYALTSVELVKFFPKGHLLLGQALEQLGDLENAEIAYEMAAKLKPREFHKAEQSLENLREKRDIDYTLENKASYKYHENQIVVVSGLPRSGTSMMMQMLEKGGVEILQDQLRQADISNPKGYYEYEPVKALYKDNSWLKKACDMVVKIVAPLLKYLDSQYRYKVIFMNRDIHEVIQSQQKMLDKDSQDFPVHLYNQFQRLLKSVTGWQKVEPGVEILYVNHRDVIKDPETVAKQVADFIGLPMDIEAMASVVDANLYRNKYSVD
jgi:predicted negative regulator of RcsB-dependent stress response